MYPLGHFLLTALPLCAYWAIRYRRVPRGHTLLLVLVATQLPDVIDKPLAWSFNIIPSGRMLAHSIVIVLPILIAICLVATRWGLGRVASLFSVAYLSHIAGDFYPILWEGTAYYFFSNLFWPLLAANPDQNPSFAAHAPPDLASLVVPLGVLMIIGGYIAVDLLIHPPASLKRLKRL